MDVRVTESVGVTVIAIDGEIDTNTAPIAQQQILPLATAGRRLVIDMTKVAYMSSAGIRMLLSTYRQVNSAGGKIVLVGLSEDVRDTMSITGFIKFFQTYDTVDAGRQALAQE